MSVTTQIIFPYMSDAHAPAMDIWMSPQDTAMALSFWQNLRSILIEADGYGANFRTWAVRGLSVQPFDPFEANARGGAVDPRGAPRD